MNPLHSLVRLLGIALFCGSVAAQQAAPPASGGAKVSGSLQLGRVAFALPPGEWQVVPLEDMWITKADYSCRCEISGAFVHWPLQQAFAIQLDPTGKQLKAAIYFRASQSTIPLVRVWYTTACEARAPALHRDGIDGNFNYPACLSIEAVESPSSGNLAELETSLWNWMKANGVETPHVLLSTKYFKYGHGRTRLGAAVREPRPSRDQDLPRSAAPANGHPMPSRPIHKNRTTWPVEVMELRDGGRVAPLAA
jgi:hypothetical protein